MAGRFAFSTSPRDIYRQATVLASTLVISVAASPVMLLGTPVPVQAQTAIAGREFEFSTPESLNPSLPATSNIPVTTTLPTEIPAIPTTPQRVEVPQTIYSRDPQSLPSQGFSSPIAEQNFQPIQAQPLDVIPIPAAPVNAQSTPPRGVANNSSAIPTSYQYQRSPVDVASSSAISRGFLPAGTTIPLAVYRQTVFQFYEPVQSHLTVVADVTNRQGQTIIPAGSIVWGTFEPVEREETRMIGSYEQSRTRYYGESFRG